jgi:hypothetical protein
LIGLSKSFHSDLMEGRLFPINIIVVYFVYWAKNVWLELNRPPLLFVCIIKVTMGSKEAAQEAIKDPNPVIDGRKANVNLAYLGAKPRTANISSLHNVGAGSKQGLAVVANFSD